jgi:hypothetical protein
VVMPNTTYAYTYHITTNACGWESHASTTRRGCDLQLARYLALRHTLYADQSSLLETETRPARCARRPIRYVSWRFH